MAFQIDAKEYEENHVEDEVQIMHNQIRYELLEMQKRVKYQENIIDEKLKRIARREKDYIWAMSARGIVIALLVGIIAFFMVFSMAPFNMFVLIIGSIAAFLVGIDLILVLLSFLTQKGIFHMPLRLVRNVVYERKSRIRFGEYTLYTLREELEDGQQLQKQLFKDYNQLKKLLEQECINQTEAETVLSALALQTEIEDRPATYLHGERV